MAASLLVKVINFNVNAEDSVGACAFFVNICFSDFSNLSTEFENCLHVFCRPYLFARQVLYKNLSLLVTHFKVALIGVK